MCLISVIIPCHNAEQWIRETLRSVVAQNFPDLEVIVIDDGSTDQSTCVAESVLCGKIAHRIIKVENGGPSRARNFGWREAKHEWIQFLDADDLLHPNKIKAQTEAASQLSPDVAVVYSNWQRTGLVSRRWMPVGEIVSPNIGTDAIIDLLKSENFLQLGSVLFRRSWLQKVGGFDEEHWLIEDVELLLKIAMAGGKFHQVPTDSPLFFYRQRVGESLSYRSAREFTEACTRNALLAESFWKANDELTPQRARFLADIYFQGARYLAQVDKIEFEKIVQKIESLVPDFLPPGPPHLRQLSKFTGYRRAERVAIAYQQLKQCFYR